MHLSSLWKRALIPLLLVSAAVLQAEQPAPGTKRPDPARFAKEIAKFDAEETSATPPPRGQIVFTGSSSIRLWKLENSFPTLPVLNRGFGGSVANDLIVYFDRVVLRYQPKILVLYTGSNDLNAKLTVDEAFADYTKFLDMVHEKLPETRVLVNSVKYSEKRIEQMDKVRALNVKLEAWCREHAWSRYVESAAHLLDKDGRPRTAEVFRADKLHLNDKGYEEWTAILRPVLEEELARLKRS